MRYLVRNPLGWLLLGGLPAARAADTEVREFAVLINGKRSGDYRLTLARQDDGTVTATLQGAMRVTKLGVTWYHYSYRGTEVWKDGRLQRLESTCDDDGKQYSVLATAEGGGLRVKVNGREHTSPAEVWVTSFWQLPPAAYHNGPVRLLGCDDGKDIRGHFQMMGRLQINAAGQLMDCTRCRVLSAEPHELWYDGQGRMVRQEWVEDGYQVTFELTRVER
jgi:Family of unknown function (DUF6134)